MSACPNIKARCFFCICKRPTNTLFLYPLLYLSKSGLPVGQLVLKYAGLRGSSTSPELLESTRPLQWYITTPWPTLIHLSLLRSQNLSDTLQRLVTATPRNF